MKFNFESMLIKVLGTIHNYTKARSQNPASVCKFLRRVWFNKIIKY